MDLFDQVSEDIKTAMKAKDKVALETLRNIKKFFLEAKTAPGANDILTDDAALKIIQKLVKQGKDSAEIYIGQGRQDLADVELGQVAVMEKYLPKQMTAEELEAALKEIITPKLDGISVVFGDELPIKNINNVCFISKKYYAGSAVSGAICVVCPQTVDYSKLFASIQYFTQLLSQTITGTERNL